jgi:D-xylose transport system substrate-binding protein
VLLPDTTSPARYVEFDAPLVTKAFTAAGLPSSDLSVQNAHGERDTGEKGAGRPTSPTVRPL